MAHFSDANEVYRHIGALFYEALGDEELGPTLEKADAVVQYQFRDPDAVVTVRALVGAARYVEIGRSMLRPDVIFQMDGDTAHTLFLGELNVPSALADGKIRARGASGKILAQIPTLKGLFPRYRAIAEAGGVDLPEPAAEEGSAAEEAAPAASEGAAPADAPAAEESAPAAAEEAAPAAAEESAPAAEESAPAEEESAPAEAPAAAEESAPAEAPAAAEESAPAEAPAAAEESAPAEAPAAAEAAPAPAEEEPAPAADATPAEGAEEAPERDPAPEAEAPADAS